MDYWILLAILTYLFMSTQFFNYVEGLVCEKNIEVPRYEVERYSERKRCSYFESCWSRIVYSTRSVVNYDTETVKYCCPGYTQVGTEGGEPVCEPICSPECINSICVSPGYCECNEGFSLRMSGYLCMPSCTPKCVNASCVRDNECECHLGHVQEQPHICVPHCYHECVDGYCESPDVCGCNSSYTLSSNGNVCIPICSVECVNGQCVAPDRCECNSGFVEGEVWNLCEPYCDNPCENAICTEPNVCTCLEGFSQVNESSHECFPHCTHDCVNGYCESPDVCGCNSSYTLSSNGTVCIPICSLECVNGHCIAPDHCECNDGFVEGEVWNLCEPYCDNPCENAICTEPNVCTCLEGFSQVNESSHECFPRCSTECVNGKCIAPEECGCNDGFDMDPETQLCVPACSNGCDNGRCVSPEICDCNNGYKNLNNSCIPHCESECINGNCTAPNDCTCNNGTLKASTYHCLTICDGSPKDRCFHETHLTMPSIAIRLTDDKPSVAFPSDNYSISVPCNYLSTLESGFYRRDYQCYTYLNFDEESVTVTCSVEIETMAAADSVNQTRNFSEWLANTTSMESQFMKLTFVHRDVSRYCTAQLCSDSNRTLYLNAVSTIRVCMEQKTGYKNTERKSRMLLILISGASLLLFVALLISAVKYYSKWKKVSYIVNTRHRSVSRSCRILQEDSSENLQCEQFESVELTKDDAEAEVNVDRLASSLQNPCKM